MADEAWSEMLRSRKVNRAQLRPRRQAYEGVNKGYGGGSYSKPDTYVSGPTCCEFIQDLNVNFETFILLFNVNFLACNAQNNCPAGAPGTNKFSDIAVVAKIVTDMLCFYSQQQLWCKCYWI